MMNYQVTENDQQGDALDERVIEIARVAKVVKRRSPLSIPCDIDHG